MTFAPIARLAGISVLTLSLAGCMDVAMTVDVQSETEAEGTVVTSMQADMVELMNAQAAETGEEFCAEGEIVARGDIVDCIVTESGPFADLSLQGDDGQGPVIEAIGNGQVRVSFPTGDISESMAESMGGEQDPQMMAMITQMFEGHSITLTVTGGEIVDTNMDVDGQSASYELPFTALFDGSLQLPEELYAVVQK